MNPIPVATNCKEIGIKHSLLLDYSLIHNDKYLAKLEGQREVHVCISKVQRPVERKSDHISNYTYKLGQKMHVMNSGEQIIFVIYLYFVMFASFYNYFKNYLK